jgi:hypothetical protein
MVTNIIEAIQKNLGYEPIKKVDPNTQEIKKPHAVNSSDKLAQAAVPAVLAGMIKFSDSQEGIRILSGERNEDWLGCLFGDKKKAAVQRVADYAGTTAAEAEEEMKRVAVEAVSITRAEVKKQDPEAIRTFMNSQRHSILGHLPAAMKIGDLLNEESFDDRTNKMEGPVSGFLHRIEDII